MLERISFVLLEQPLCFAFPRKRLPAFEFILSLLKISATPKYLLSTLTLMVLGDGNGTSTVANAGPVSPALISPPRPLDLLRERAFVVPFGAERGDTASLEVVIGERISLAATMLNTPEGQALRIL